MGDDGSAQRVRAHYWADDVIRTVAATYPAPPALPLPDDPAAPTSEPAPVEAPHAAPGAGSDAQGARPPCKRTPRKTTAAGQGAEVA
ncbi:hypothetical protein [Cellulomonas sp. URHB0016]